VQQCLYTSSAGAAVLLQRCSCSVRLEAVRPSRWAVDLAVAEPPGSRRTLLSSASRRHAPSSGRDAAARHTGSHGKPTAGNRFHRGPAPQCPSRTTPRSAFITGGSMQREQHRLASHAVRTAERPPVVATGGRLCGCCWCGCWLLVAEGLNLSQLGLRQFARRFALGDLRPLHMLPDALDYLGVGQRRDIAHVGEVRH